MVYYPVFRFKQLPQSLGWSCGGLLGLLLAVFVVGQRANHHTSQLFEEYGQSLANLTSIHSVNSAVNNDLVGLHALLQGVVTEPRVLFASVHDAGDRLLVQAGEPYWDVKVGEFSADIKMQDDYGGRITIVLEQTFSGEAGVRWAITGVALLLTLMVLLSLYESHGIAWELRRWQFKKAAPGKQGVSSEPGVTNDTEAEVVCNEEVGCNELDVTDPGLEPKPDQNEPEADTRALSYLYVRSVNGSVLQQQLSAELFASILSDFNGVLTRVLALYDGEYCDGDIVNGLRLKFYASENVMDAQFQSLCAAYLLQSSMDKNRFRLKLSSLVSSHFNAEPLALEGAYCAKDCDEGLLERIDVEDSSDQEWRVLGLKEAFAYLVEHNNVQLTEAPPA